MEGFISAVHKDCQSITRVIAISCQKFRGCFGCSIIFIETNAQLIKNLQERILSEKSIKSLKEIQWKFGGIYTRLVAKLDNSFE